MSSTPTTQTTPHSEAGPELEYRTARIHGTTFSNQTLRDWTESHLEGRVLNATAGPTHLTHPSGGEIVRNDIDPDADADRHLDVRELSQHYQPAFDTVLYDPPYSERQASVTYDCGFPGYQPDVTSELDAVLRSGGKVIQFGYTGDGLARHADYHREHVMVVNTLGRRHDVLALIDRKPTPNTPKAQPNSAVTGSVVMNEYANRPTNTQSTPFTLHYEPLVDPHDLGDPLPDPVREWTQSQFQGRVLVLYPGTHFTYPGSVIENHPTDTPPRMYDPTSRGWRATSSTALTNLEAFAEGRFDTIVFGPPASAFFENTTVDGSTTGLDTHIKHQIHDLLAEGGRLIQLGHTSTGMSSTYDYRRHAVAVFTTPGNSPAIHGVVDENHSRTLQSFTTPPLPERAITCVRCPTAWDLHQGRNPAFDVHCPSCEAVTQEACYTPSGGVRDEPHPARVETAFTLLANAEPCHHPDGHLFDHPRYA